MRKSKLPFLLERLEDRDLLSVSDLLLSEFLAVNDRGLQDEDGDTSDWVEIYNNGGEEIDLGGLMLSDGRSSWTFPSQQLDAHESVLVFASGKDRTTSPLHANFQLSAEGERLALLRSDGTTVIHQYAPYPPQTSGVSYGIAMSVGEARTILASQVEARFTVPTNDDFGLRWTEIDFDDSEWTLGTTGIGYENSGSNYAPLLNARVPVGTIGFYARIRFDAQDVGAISRLTLQMRYDDGFIAYLNGHRVAAGNGATDPRFDSPSTGENSDSNAVVFEPFDISAYQDLLLPAGNVLAIHSLNRSTSSSDLLMMPQIQYAQPGGTNSDQLGYFATPTPLGTNGTPVAGFTAPVVFDLPHGFYDAPQPLTIASSHAGATIRYTTDGSVPTATTGTVYTGPLAIDHTMVVRAAAFDGDRVPLQITTASYFFTADVAAQDRRFTLNAGFPSSWNGTSADYGMDPDVVGPTDDFNGRYAETIADDLLSIPTLSIVMNVDDMFGADGIYANPTNANLEKAASLELVLPDGTEGFQIDAGIKIQGGAFRSFGLTKKKSFRFKFQDEYGPTKLRYPLFGPDATDSFDTITLRMEANDGWQWSSGDNTNRLYTRDEFGRRTQLAMGQPASHGMFGHVYINGIYWGTYNVVERPDEAFASDYIGGDKEDWDVQNSGTAINGDLQSWTQLNQIAQQIDALPDGSSQQLELWMQMQGLLPDGSPHPTAEDLLDVENYIDYLIVNFYGGNSDWPHKNYYAGRQRGPDSTGYQFFMWDSEWSLNLRSDVTTNQTGQTSGIASVYGELRRVPEFQLWFADRIQKHFSPGGALYVDSEQPQWDPEHPERNVPAARFFELTNQMRSPLVAESARWGDQHDAQPHTVDASWEPQVASMLESYFPRRTANVLTQFQRAGFTAATPTPVFRQQGGVADELTLHATTGQIYFTTDGSDPRLPGGALAPQAQLYTQPIPIMGDVHIRTRTLDGTAWSAIDEASFLPAQVVPADASNLAITEIHYHPLDAQLGELDVDQDEFEFVEVTNVGPAIINLDQVRFVETNVDGVDQGIRFTFAPQSLAPGKSLVVVENVDAFQSRYGTEIAIARGMDQPLDPIGQYGGKLSNSGETLRLLDASDQVVRHLTYHDTFHPITDGEGPSLEINNPQQTSRDLLSTPALWRASEAIGGTPGVHPSASGRGDFSSDGQVNRDDVDWLYAAIALGKTDAEFDLTGDGIVNNRDADVLIREVMGIGQGDADLDGDVDFADFLALSANFGARNANWLAGDFDGDDTVQFADFLLLSAQFGKRQVV